ncbi:MAG: Ca-activated chloride channel [Blastocatellia bacterium]|jgi:Ca-activated chloride channel family protein|nr:Ca-activated chloride channel [Blastocatellia bacterium]
MKDDNGKTSNGSKNFLSRRAGAHAGKRQLFLVACLIASLLLASCQQEKTKKSVAGVAEETPTSDTTTANVATSASPNGVASTMAYDGRQESQASNTEAYTHFDDNPFIEASRAPLSTFSIDVDTASYSNTRRFITDGQLPPKDAVRIEELVNYFSYDYPQPVGEAPFSVTAEVSEAPWNKAHRLVHIGLQGKRIAPEQMPPANLVFLLDVSGSMNEPRKLPLVKSALKMLIEQLGARDRIAIVVYAGSSGLALPSTTGDRKGEILAALDRLEAGGSTNGAEGIQLAYQIAQQNFIKGGANRVILATDGDFNVGVTSEGDLVRLIEEKREGGVFLSVLGFGTGNVKDSTMEKLADKGNGNYAYIDTLGEARKALGEQIGGTLFTIAKDVKIQVEFNPKQAAAYRLIGYENRLLRDQDFNDDTKDAGEIGAGHTVTALYEVVPFGQKFENAGVDPLKYQQPSQTSQMADSRELMNIKLRYKEPDASFSKLLNIGLADAGNKLNNASENFKFASAVAEFGMLLRASKYKADASYTDVLQLARSSTGTDLHGYRNDFINMVETARTLSSRRAALD